MQNDPRQKAGKLKPVVRAREIQADQQLSRLVEIRQRKTELVIQLRKYQKDYVDGVELLNQERSSAARSRLLALEGAVDHSKSIWYQTLRAVQEVESRERVQMQEVLAAERNLKSVEKLLGKHLESLRTLDRQKDQKTMDELAIRRVSRG